MKKKNAQVHATQIKATTLTESAPKELKGHDAEAYLGLAAKVAKSTVYYRYKRIPNAEKHFPLRPLLRSVEKYFPYAEGGPLWLDEPTDEQELRECGEKAAAMKAEGLRYIIIPRGLNDIDVNDALSKIKESA